MNLAPERDAAAETSAPDPLGPEFRVPLECVLDPLLHGRCTDTRSDLDKVGQTNNAANVANGISGGVLLILPLDFAGERDPALLDLDLDGILGNRNVPVDHVGSAARNVLVRCVISAEDLHFDLLGNAAHAPHRLYNALGGFLFGIGTDAARKSDDAVVNSDGSRRRDGFLCAVAMGGSGCRQRQVIAGKY